MQGQVKVPRALIASGLVLMSVLLLAVSVTKGGDSEWTTNVFEEAILIEREPDHQTGRAPFDNEPLTLTISSKGGQFMNAADVRYTVRYNSQTSPEGGYQFTRVNQTVMSVDIPGYPGGAIIQYRLVAYDEKNHPLTSTTYSYTVVKNGSWQGFDFESNLRLEWGPKNPKIGEPVTLNLTTRDPLTPIFRADLLYTVNLPDQDPLDGVAFFERYNATHATATLIPYPPGSRVTFYVDAYDNYQLKVTSKAQTYQYPVPPAVGPVYEGILFVVIRDKAGNGPADGAQVTFSNQTYSFGTEAFQGIAMTNRTVRMGNYTVTIVYKDQTYVRKVTVPRTDGSFTFRFDVNEKKFMVPYSEAERPGLLELLGGVISVALLGSMVYAVNKVKKARETLNEKKKRSRKMDSKEGFTKLEGLLADEERRTLLLRVGAFLLISILGVMFAPFYPWWMAILLVLFLVFVSVKYPYISLLLLTVIVTAATAYQSREFGWVYLVFSLIVMVGGFFDWRYSYLTMLTVFSANLGFGFAVPVAAVLAFSLFMGSVVMLSAGGFLLVTAPSGNFSWFSFISSSEGGKSFVTFSRAVPSGWGPVDMFDEISGLTNVDTMTISNVLKESMGSIVPLFGLLGWVMAMIAAYLIFRKLEDGRVLLGKDPKVWAIRAVPGVLVFIFSLISIIWLGNGLTFWFFLVSLFVVPAGMVGFAVRAFGEETLPSEYGVMEVKSSDVGRKISDMVGFRKASFNEIGGLEDVKREVKNSLMVPLLEPEMATKYGVKPSKGIMLFGPPGCGKTLMLRAVASDLNVDMIGVKCSDVMSKWYGESENLIASLFTEARARSPCILFLDEIDSIAKRRDFYSTDDVTPRVLSIMLSEMDGMDEAEGIIVVGTTNMPDLVDPALMRPGRFDKIIYIPPPDLPSREQIIKIHLKGKYVEKDIDTKEIARRTDGFSGADIANLVREASSIGLERALETKKPQPITQKDIFSVLDEIRPSVSPTMLKMYDKLRREYERKKGSRTSEKEDVTEKEGERIDGEAARKKNNRPRKGSRPVLEGEFEEVQEES